MLCDDAAIREKAHGPDGVQVRQDENIACIIDSGRKHRGLPPVPPRGGIPVPSSRCLSLGNQDRSGSV